MTRTYFGGLLAVVGALACTVASSSGQVIFSDDFTAADGTALPGRIPITGQAWTQPAGGAMTIQNGGINTAGGARTAFGNFAQTFDGTQRLLKLTIDFTALSHNDGYAGVSLYDGDNEHIFVGDLSGTNPSIGFQVNFGTAVYAVPTTATGVVTLLYDWQTGRTSLYPGTATTGTPLGVLLAAPNINFTRLRIQNGNGGDIAISSVSAEMQAQGPVSVDYFDVDLPISRTADHPFLNWGTSFADQVTITDVGSVGTSGNQELILTPGDHTYQITAKDSGTGNTATASTILRSVVGGESTFRYVRYKTLKTRDETTTTWTQLTEFAFYNSTGQVTPVGVQNPGGATNPNVPEDASKVIDNDLTTKWLDYNKAPLIFDFGASPPPIGSYAITTGNDGADRDPVRWTLEGSNDGTAWTLIDNVTAFDFPTPATRTTSTLQIPLPGSSLIPYVSVTGSATTLVSGDALYLNYQSAGSQTLVINDGATNTTLTAANGTLTLHPTQTTTYTLTASSPGATPGTATFAVNVITPVITTIAYSDFDNSGNELALFGSAQILNDFANRPLPGDHKRLRLTDQVNGQSSTVWFRKRQNVGQGFDTTFNMQISRLDSATGADGLAFIVQNSPAGSNLQVINAETGAQTNALSVAFDTFVNGTEQSPATLRIASAGTELALVDLATIPGITLRGAGALLDPTGQGAPYPVHVVYTPGSLSVYFEDILVVDHLAVNLATLGAVDATGTAYVGFASRTGGLAEAHDITSWSLTSGVVAPSDFKLISSSFNFTTNEVTLTWTSTAAKTYRVTTSSDLTGWSGVLRSGIPGAAGQTTATVPFPRSAKGFFRVEQE
ncbi:MAG: symbB [Akkermansiaceae bacterium]|nr:symbB [Akkermansiaceae bacterium]